MKRAVAILGLAAALGGCTTVYQPVPVVVEDHTPSAYWTVVQEQNRADLARRARWEAEEALRRQQWTDAEIDHERTNDLARFYRTIR